ncbi:molybdenum ABC transporter ATP-binding protein [Rhodoferax sediminis]|uniref:molybdenum ABC transporter ATP-binding protein n=1 Tax=Rhodoferax sediminis TaxID=2509614 RepID=UPI001AEFC735|nr:molybdenum ABC transporter ATP-binding protein [Rhodoferax sediminis]
MSTDGHPAVLARLQLNYAGFALDVDLALPGRKVSALFGPSGSGKTTCLRAIAGLERARGGYVEVNGEVWQDDARGLFVPTHQRALGYVFQEPSLFAHLTVAQNMAYGMKRVPPAQRRVSLAQAVELLGMGPLMQRSPATLSGGERQRVAIARALATSPRILLMDEPLAALDAKRKAEILPYLERLHGELDIPVLYVSHAPDEVARLADHMVLLDAGKMVASGATFDLMTRLDLPLAHGDSAGAVISATVARHEAGYHLTLAEFSGGQLSLPQQTIHVGHAIRVRIQARDVSLTLQRQSGTSVLNILPATIMALASDSPGQVMVRLDAGGSPLLARITLKSADALALAVGQTVFAQIKGVAILG